MSKFKFSKNSLDKLRFVHPNLVEVITMTLLLSPYDFSITEGLRTKERQNQLVAEGKSQTINSKHLAGDDGLSRAVDIVVLIDGLPTWEMKYYTEIADIALEVAKELNINLVWGGTWKNFKDGVHFQLGI